MSQGNKTGYHKVCGHLYAPLQIARTCTDGLWRANNQGTLQIGLTTYYTPPLDSTTTDVAISDVQCVFGPASPVNSNPPNLTTESHLTNEWATIYYVTSNTVYVMYRRFFSTQSWTGYPQDDTDPDLNNTTLQRFFFPVSHWRGQTLTFVTNGHLIRISHRGNFWNPTVHTERENYSVSWFVDNREAATILANDADELTPSNIAENFIFT